MKKIISFLPATCFFILCHAQNVGVGTLTPAEKLDVNGNVNLSGQLKLNGDAGAVNQYLMKDGSNNPVWGDLSGYKKLVVFDCGAIALTADASNCTGTWAVPAGTTEVLVECWGGGGGGGTLTGGGGGAYNSTKVTGIAAGTSITYTLGAGGSYGSTSASGIKGGNSVVNISGVQITANGGAGGTGGTVLAGGSISEAEGGYFSGGAGGSTIGFNGSPGGITRITFATAAATDFAKIIYFGNGGDAAFLPGSGGQGGYQIISATVTSQVFASFKAAQAGGGGGADATGGYFGRGGRIVIHY